MSCLTRRCWFSNLRWYNLTPMVLYRGMIGGDRCLSINTRRGGGGGVRGMMAAAGSNRRATCRAVGARDKMTTT